MSGFGASPFGSGGIGVSGFSSGVSFGAPPSSQSPSGPRIVNSDGIGHSLGGGFGAAPSTSLFGSAPSNGGFGAAPSSTSGFGGVTTTPVGSIGFGTTSGVRSFPSSTPGFGSSIAGGFGAMPVSSAPSFGISTSIGGLGSATSLSGGYTAAPSPTGFGVAPSVPGGFGVTAAPTGFAASPATLQGFVSTSSGAFRAAPAFDAAPSFSSGFSATSAPSVFGGSSQSSSSTLGASFSNSLVAVVPNNVGYDSSNNSPFVARAPNHGGFEVTQTNAFGASQPIIAGFNNAGNNLFGVPIQAPPAQVAFPFNQHSTQASNAFGTPSNSAGNTNGFGTLFGYGGASTEQSRIVPPGNPFGAATAAPAPPLTFGTSSTVVQTTEVSMHDEGSDSNEGVFHHGNSVDKVGFAQQSPVTVAFNRAPPVFAPYFVPTEPFGAAALHENTQVQDDNMEEQIPIHSPIPEASMFVQPHDIQLQENPDNVDTSRQEELARLKAKLAAKKKKLEEAKQRKNVLSGYTPPTSPKRQSAPSKVHDSAETSSAARATEFESLAERNAQRFAPKVNATRSHLPDDLEPSHVSTENDFDAINLQHATSLEGTCMYMCPDDELQRREREGDIQLLEMIHPDIHPVGWNLRNTVVKRFRRSAADYKLDIPELVRPPDVLERVCGYLEEWVMERDRQGIDPRFSTGAAPTPLEVYQFIWDRTRMIRKDFILQNYVGTGGKCDARAVRCHERIARWHAMCEHQLSHIPDFVRMQSQQNIAELGQAMKTLNLLYDDSLRRSTVDVPDETGQETRLKSNGHGCESNVVMGASPVDFDGTCLVNDEHNVPRRIIGSNSSMRGTAEPEMRAIYILLTIENDGGMEVLKYVAKMSSERPQVFNSKPVQLALEIFKAKHELNYARFFSILRASTTPYLFACLMFKHVEEMRRVAIRVMFMTYGYKKKESPPIQDQYPLATLVRLLCFEDIDEARTTCRHYNITTKEVELPSSSSATGKKRLELIFWKASRFAIPKDETKGVVIPLKPRKMLRTIESKLKGVTRLAVCRGEVSGDGSVLLQVKETSDKLVAPAVSGAAGDPTTANYKEAVCIDNSCKEVVRTQKEEDQLRRKVELMRKQEDKKLVADAAKRAGDEEKARILKLQELELLKAKKKAKEGEQRRQREEREKMKQAELARQAEAAQEKIMLLAAAKLKKKTQEEEEKRKAEELKREHERLMLQEKERREKERIRKQTEAIEHERRKEEHRLRLRSFQEQLDKQNEEKRVELEKEAKRKSEEEAKVREVKTFLLWRRMRRVLDKRVQSSKIEQSIMRIDPTLPPLLRVHFFEQFDDTENKRGHVNDLNHSNDLTLADFLEELTSLDTDTSQLFGHVHKTLRALESSNPTFLNIHSTSAYNLTIAFIVPEFDGVQAETTLELLHQWIDRRFRYDVLQTFRSDHLVIRFIAVNGNAKTHFEEIDFALLIIPPFMNDVSYTDAALKCILTASTEKIPVFALNLDDGSDPVYKAFVEKALRICRAEGVVETDGNETCDFEDALCDAFSKVMIWFVEDEKKKRDVFEIQFKKMSERLQSENMRILAEARRRSYEENDKSKIILQNQHDMEDTKKVFDDIGERMISVVGTRAIADLQSPAFAIAGNSQKKRSIQSDDEPLGKRAREESERIRESKSFTARLNAMMRGDIVIDAKVGETSLRYLLENVPAVHPARHDRHVEC